MTRVSEKCSIVATSDLKDLAGQPSPARLLSSDEIESAIELIVDFPCSASIKEINPFACVFLTNSATKRDLHNHKTSCVHRHFLSVVAECTRDPNLERLLLQ